MIEKKVKFIFTKNNPHLKKDPEKLKHELDNLTRKSK